MLANGEVIIIGTCNLMGEIGCTVRYRVTCKMELYREDCPPMYWSDLELTSFFKCVVRVM